MKEKKSKPKKAVLHTAIYVRVSTDEQAKEGFSIRAQAEKLKAYALLKEWEIYDIYSDEGKSGKNIVERPDMNRLIEDIENGNVNNVLVFKVDRLTRSTKNLIELVELFEDNNCAFNSLTESIDTDTPSGRMFLKIIGIFAEFERENLVSRLKLGFERKVKEGYTLANYSLSYGYTKKKGQKVQKVQPEEAKIVKDIFSMYLDENKAMSRIAKILNEREIETKRHGKTWAATTIKAILTNPTYIGKVRYLGLDKDKYFEVDGRHEGIISEETFSLAQEKISNTKKTSRTKRPKEENYFCGILVCGLCGSKFTTHNYACKVDEHGEKQYRSSYRCNKKIYYNDGITCRSPGITHKKVEQAFAQYIEKINDFAEIEKIDLGNNSKKSKEQEQLEYIHICEDKLKKLQQRKKHVMEQYISEEITFENYKEMLKVFNEKYKRLEMEMQRAEKDMPIEEKSGSVLLEDIIFNLKENWDYLDNKERMLFLQRFIKKIVIRVEKESANSCIAKIEEVIFNAKTE